MLVLYFSGNYSHPTLIGITYTYLFCDDHQTFVRSEDQLLENFMNPTPGVYSLVASPIRIPHADLDPGYNKRYAYTGIRMSFEPRYGLRDAWRTLRNNLDILRWMEAHDIPENTVRLIETHMWKSIPSHLRTRVLRVLGHFLRGWSAERAETYLAPDYVWKAPGPRQGRRTVDVMHDQFLAHVFIGTCL